MEPGTVQHGADNGPDESPGANRFDPDATLSACAAHPQLAEEIRAAVRALRLAAGDAHTSAEPFAGGSVFGRLHFRGRLGSGGMATVHRAHDPLLDRDVAVKLLPASMADAPVALERFRREARALARIRHPHIVAIHDFGESEGTLWFTMDLVEGESLHDVLGRHAGADPATLQATDLGPADAAGVATRATTAGSYVEAVARMIAKLADALDHAHRDGLVHRDVKPGNIMIDLAGEPQLVDFGLARGDDAATVTHTGVGPGTPAYMAPEQISGRRPVGPRTDVYGLGVTLYEALTLRRPFFGETTERVFHAVLTSEPDPPRRWNPQIPRDLETVCLTAIDKDPERRYPTAAAFADDLRSLLNLRPIRARPASPLTRAARLLRRNPAPVSAAVALAIAFAAMGFFTLVRKARVRAEFDAHLATARQALDTGDLATAKERVQRAVAADPESADARVLSGAVDIAVAAAAHAADLAEAQGQLAEYQARVEEIIASRKRAATLTESVLSGLSQDPDPFALPREEERLRDLRVQAETHWLAGTQALNRAEGYVPGRPAVQHGRADLLMARWRLALEEGDIAVAEAYAKRVREQDDEGRYLAELAGEVALTLEGSPVGAEVHLFRYELQARLRPDGEPRLVPVPFHPARGRIRSPAEAAESPFAPGDTALAVVAVAPGSAAAAAGVRPRDLITHIAGVRVQEAVWVVAVDSMGSAARAGVARLDRLTHFAGQSVCDESEIESAHARLPAGAEYQAVFARAGRQCPVATRRVGALWEDLGVRLGTAAEALAGSMPDAGLVLQVVSEGMSGPRQLTAGGSIGIEGVLTAYPLVFTADNVLGVLPLESVRMLPGSYLLVLGRALHEDLRLPLHVLRGSAAMSMRADLLTSGSTPPGFLYVAPGPSIYGGDPEALGARGRRVTNLSGFFIARTEVTQAEYVEFLNDPATLGMIDAHRPDGLILVPRDSDGPLWSRGRDDRYAPDGDLRRPVHNITGTDAQAYLDWRNEMGRRRGDRWHYCLPSTEEWEKAARGVDGRWYPWGDAFAWSFCCSQPARPDRSTSEPVLRFLADESPYGVRDLAGGVLEWLAFGIRLDRRHNLDRTEWRGGSWGSCEAREFRAASRGNGDPNRIGRNDGFRLVVRPITR